MINPARGCEHAAIAGPPQAKGEIDIFVIRAEERIIAPGKTKCPRAIECTRTAGAEDFLDGPGGEPRGWLAVTPFGRPAEQPVRIAGRVHAIGLRSNQHQRRDFADGHIGECARPAWIQPTLTSVSLLSN